MSKQHRVELAALLGTGKNRVKRKKYVYSGKATQIAPNKLREEGINLEIKLADGTRVRGCFALRHCTRQVLGIAFDYHSLL
jgi:putative transposase